MKLKECGIELPYYFCYNNYNKNNNNNNNTSYGIICVSQDGYIIINQSQPYIINNIKKQNKYFYKQNYCRILLNTNEKYNLTLNLFPNASLEGEYTLPKGKIDDMDKKNCVNTKVREFIEETKHSHPCFKPLLDQHFNDRNFKSFLNDENFIIRESWIGLDNKIYHCEYSVLVINSMSELIPVNNNNNNTVPFNYFLSQFKVYANCNKYYKRYKQSSNLDKKKNIIILPIKKGIELLNEHKINATVDNDKDSRIQIDDILQIMSYKKI